MLIWQAVSRRSAGQSLQGKMVIDERSPHGGGRANCIRQTRVGERRGGGRGAMVAASGPNRLQTTGLGANDTNSGVQCAVRWRGACYRVRLCTSARCAWDFSGALRACPALCRAISMRYAMPI